VNPADRQQAFLAGARACIPLSPGVLLFGMVCGAAAAGAGLTPGQSFALSWMVFAGSSQIVATQLFAAGAPGWVIVLTGWVVNLRFMMYSASLAQHFRGESRGARWLAGYLLTDQAFGVTLARVLDGRRDIPWFFLGIAATLWLLWQIASLAGIYLGALVPPRWSIDFVVALTFIGVLAPLLARPRPGRRRRGRGTDSPIYLDPAAEAEPDGRRPGRRRGRHRTGKLWPKSRSGA
jgi:predicted branched-subunit amino acid permease